jgi:hypothetical protein
LLSLSHATVAIAANFVLSSLNLVALMTKATRSSETSVLARATRRHITEDGILHLKCVSTYKTVLHPCIYWSYSMMSN